MVYAVKIFSSLEKALYRSVSPPPATTVHDHGLSENQFPAFLYFGDTINRNHPRRYLSKNYRPSGDTEEPLCGKTARKDLCKGAAGRNKTEMEQKMTRINIGCGQTPTKGWKNFDNSFSLRLAKITFFPNILYRLRFLEDTQYHFITFARENDIRYGDATKGLPLKSESCEVVYSSHMLEHLDRNGANKFLKEAYRVLRPGGIIRIAAPDIKKQIAQYNDSGDADAFIEATHMCVPRPNTLAQRIRLLLVGPRHHQWMYDGNTLSRLLEKHDFIEAEIMPPGKTNIPKPGSLDLQERSSESVYVEAKKPSA